MSDSNISLPPEPSLPPLPPAPKPPNTIFRGPNGLRAGGRVLRFLMIVVGLFLWLLVALRFFFGARNRHITLSQLTPFGLAMSEATIFIFTSIAALIMARMEGRKYGDYGLPARFAFRRNFWLGTLMGFLAISGSLLAIFALHGFRITGLAIHGSLIPSATASWTAAFIIVGLSEEFAFRGYLQYTLTTGMGFWPAAFLLSAFFGLAHRGNPGESKFGLFSVVLFGLLFCLFLRRTGNLWLPVGFHAGWDWGQTFFYGVRDSGIAPYHSLLNSDFSGSRWLTGGTVGPEASVFTPIVLAIVAIVFTRMYRENRYHAP
jgi:hypothetical protein